MLSLPLRATLLRRLAAAAGRHSGQPQQHQQHSVGDGTQGTQEYELIALRDLCCGGLVGGPWIVAPLSDWTTSLEALRTFGNKVDAGADADEHSSNSIGLVPFCGLSDFQTSGFRFYLAQRDPERWIETPAFTEAAATLPARSGRFRVTPDSFWTDVLGLAFPDAAEIPSLDVSMSCTTKRVRKSVDLGATWVHSVVTSGMEQLAGNDPSAAAVHLVPVIQGGSDDRLREQAVNNVLKEAQRLQAFAPLSEQSALVVAVGGLGLSEPIAQREQLLTKVISQFPVGTLSFVNVGSVALAEVIGLVRSRVSVITTGLAESATQLNFALIFEIEVDLHESTTTSENSSATRINISDRSLARSTMPLVPGCSCDACAYHTRAYLHHLVSTHELLAPVLLSVHNWFHMLKWMAVLRRHLAAGTLDLYEAAWRRVHFG